MIRNVIPFLAKREDLGSLARSVLRCPPDDVHRNIFTIINEMPVPELQKRPNEAISEVMCISESGVYAIDRCVEMD